MEQPEQPEQPEKDVLQQQPAAPAPPFLEPCELVCVTLLPYKGGSGGKLARTPAYTLAGRRPEGLTAEVEVAHEVGKTQVRRQPSPDLLVEQPLELTEYLRSLVPELAHLVGS